MVKHRLGSIQRAFSILTKPNKANEKCTIPAPSMAFDELLESAVFHRSCIGHKELTEIAESAVYFPDKEERLRRCLPVWL